MGFLALPGDPNSYLSLRGRSIALVQNVCHQTPLAISSDTRHFPECTKWNSKVPYRSLSLDQRRRLNTPTLDLQQCKYSQVFSGKSTQTRVHWNFGQ